MSKSLFNVSFKVTGEKLPTVLQVLTKEVIGLSITSDADAPVVTMKQTRRRFKRNGQTLVEKTVEWVRALPVDTEFTREQVREFLVSVGGAPTNDTPVMSEVVNKALLAVSPRRGVYKRTAKA